MGQLRKTGMLGLVLLLACSLASIAWGDPSKTVSGAGLVLEKNLESQTVLLDGQVELQVTPETRIVDANGKLIGLELLPTAPRKGPFTEITSEASVRYEATRKQGKLVAISITQAAIVE